MSHWVKSGLDTYLSNVGFKPKVDVRCPLFDLVPFDRRVHVNVAAPLIAGFAALILPVGGIHLLAWINGMHVVLPKAKHTTAVPVHRSVMIADG